MDLTLPIPVIDTAVSMRDLSKYKQLRVQAASVYSKTKADFFHEENKFSFLEELEGALYFSMIITYAQGMHLLSKASEEYKYQLKLDQIAKIWRGGCIIRSRFLEVIYAAFEKDQNLPHLLLDNSVQAIINKCLPSLQSVVISAISHGVAIPSYLSSLSYFDTLRSENMPANLIQAQRDYFGAHTYERIGKEGIFHTQWESK
jgi:6-phosphogluconate dehydrogenase